MSGPSRISDKVCNALPFCPLRESEVRAQPLPKCSRDFSAKCAGIAMLGHGRPACLLNEGTSFATGRLRSRMMISSPPLANVRYLLSQFLSSATFTLRMKATSVMARTPSRIVLEFTITWVWPTRKQVIGVGAPAVPTSREDQSQLQRSRRREEATSTAKIVRSESEILSK